MGINGLWKIIQPAEVVTTIEDVAVLEGYQENRRGNHTLSIGVDTDAIMSQCIAATYSKNVHRNVPLRIFFYKLCKYLRVPVTWIFIFDGSGRPKMKNGRLVPSASSPSWYGPCQTLIKSFGFHVHQAPGEGEAELAQMNELGLINIILTSDSDVFAFGAKTVFRSSSSQQSPTNNHNELGLYKSDTIKMKKDVSLTKGGLILIALLSGGDYTAGVCGCGEAIAHGLAKCGFGNTLYDACKVSDGIERRKFIVTWLVDVCEELRTNSKNFLPSRKPSLADNLHKALFPKNEVINLYINPLTSFSHSQNPPNTDGWPGLPMEPNIPKICSMALDHLGWRDEAELERVFHSNLWEGILLRMLFSPLKLINPDTKFICTPTFSARIIQLLKKNRQTERQSTITSWYCAIICTENFLSILRDATAASAGSARVFKKKPKTQQNLTELSVWVPESYFPPFISPFKRGGNLVKPVSGNSKRKSTQTHSEKAVPVAPATSPHSILSILNTLDKQDDKSVETKFPPAKRQRREPHTLDLDPLDAKIAGIYSMDLTPALNSSPIPQVAESSSMAAHRVIDLTVSSPPIEPSNSYFMDLTELSPSPPQLAQLSSMAAHHAQDQMNFIDLTD